MTTKQRNKISYDQWALLAVIAIGGFCSFGGEISGFFTGSIALAFSLLPPFAFIVLRGYVVMLGNKIRRQAKDGSKIANFWTSVAFVCGAVYIWHLHKDMIIQEPLMWSLQAVNLMMIPAEIYFGIISGKHPAKIELEKLEIKFELVGTEIETAKSKIKTLESEIEALELRNEAFRIEINENSIASETAFNELARLNGIVSKTEKALSKFKSIASEIKQVNNWKVCHCPECGSFNKWGIAAKALICSECNFELLVPKTKQKP